MTLLVISAQKHVVIGYKACNFVVNGEQNFAEQHPEEPGPRTSNLALNAHNVLSTNKAIWWWSDGAHSVVCKLTG